MGQIIEGTQQQIIETDEAGRLIIPPEMLDGEDPHCRFTVEKAGKIIIVKPEVTDNQKQTADEWMQEWRELAEEIGKVWPKGISAVDVISEMRR